MVLNTTVDIFIRSFSRRSHILLFLFCTAMGTKNSVRRNNTVTALTSCCGFSGWFRFINYTVHMVNDVLILFRFKKLNGLVCSYGEKGMGLVTENAEFNEFI